MKFVIVRDMAFPIDSILLVSRQEYYTEVTIVKEGVKEAIEFKIYEDDTSQSVFNEVMAAIRKVEMNPLNNITI